MATPCPPLKNKAQEPIKHKTLCKMSPKTACLLTTSSAADLILATTQMTDAIGRSLPTREVF
jgi:hypothetical protein